MIFSVTIASDWEYEDEVEINTIEELKDFVEENGEIIINREFNEIKIYNYYVE